MHVHVEGNGGMAKFTWNGTEFELNEKQGIKANDFKKIKRVIDDNAGSTVELRRLKKARIAKAYTLYII